MTDHVQAITRHLAWRLDPDVLGPRIIRRRSLAIGEAITNLAPDIAEWCEIDPDPDGSPRALALGERLIYIIRTEGDNATGLRVQPLRHKDLRVAQCVEEHDVDSRRRTWRIELPDETVSLATEQHNGSDHVPRNEQLAQALARAVGWPVSDTSPSEISP